MGLVPITIFFTAGLLDRNDFHNTLNWSVLILIGGGLALGHVMERSFLAPDFFEGSPAPACGGVNVGAQPGLLSGDGCFRQLCLVDRRGDRAAARRCERGQECGQGQPDDSDLGHHGLCRYGAASFLVSECEFVRGAAHCQDLMLSGITVKKRRCRS